MVAVLDPEEKEVISRKTGEFQIWCIYNVINNTLFVLVSSLCHSNMLNIRELGDWYMEQFVLFFKSKIILNERLLGKKEKQVTYQCQV